jgi:secondary thiamine-phosphate synthase enzyme
VELHRHTNGFNDIVDITAEVAVAVKKDGLQEGMAHLFVRGSTAALTTIEHESGAPADLLRALDRIAPMHGHYAHNEAWRDGNGYAHLRAALIQPDLCIPIISGNISLGT